MKKNYSKSSAQMEANREAVKSVRNILSMNNIKCSATESTITMDGKAYVVTTNMRDNELTGKHYFTMKQIYGYKEANIAGLILYHTATNSCVIFSNPELFYNEIEQCKTLFKKFVKKNIDDETGEEVSVSSYMPYVMTDYKMMCQRFGYLTTPDNLVRVDRWMNTKSYKKAYYRKYA